jgi:hypothetical protein
MANTREPILQPIPILSLRPTQMTVGMREVKEKRKRLREYRTSTTTWLTIIIWRARFTTRA